MASGSVLATAAGVDSGYGYMKVAVKGKVLHYPNVVAEGVQRTLQFASRTDTGKQPAGDLTREIDVTVRDVETGQQERFMFGDSASKFGRRPTYIFDRNRVESGRAKAAIFTALGLLQEAEEEDYLAVIGAPIKEYESLDRLYRASFPSSMDVIFEAGPKAGQRKRVNILGARVIPQGLGIYFDYMLDDQGVVKNKNLMAGWTGIVDPGFRTTNVLAVVDGEVVDVSAEQTEDGMLVTHQAVQAFLEEKGITLPIARIREIVEQGYVETASGKVDVTEVRDNALRQTAKNIRSVVLSKAEEWHLDIIRRILVGGGGGAALFNYLDLPRKELVPDPQLSNAKGFEKLARRNLKGLVVREQPAASMGA